MTDEIQKQPPAEVRLTEETIKYLEQKMANAVQAGIQGAINEKTAEAFWAAGFKVLQTQASQHTGRFVLGGMWSLLNRVAVFLVLGGVVYAIGGWSALATLGKAIFGGGQ